MKIIVLGNGFDLGCDLPTSYTDFFNYRKEVKKDYFTILYNLLNLKKSSASLADYNEFRHSLSHNPKLETKLKESLTYDFATLNENIVSEVSKLIQGEINFWDIFFWISESYETGNESSWSKIEEKIESFILNKSNKVPFEKQSLNSKYNLNSHKPNYRDNISSEYFTNILYDIDKKNLRNVILNSFFQSTKSNSTTSLDSYLLEQLKKFEECFREYIKLVVEKIINKNSKNQRIYRDNLLKLIGDEEITNYFLINFNYTMFSNSIENLKKNRLILQRNQEKVEVIELNVHGRFDVAVIFGIDQSKIDANKSEYFFTKTYRKLESSDILSTTKLPEKSEISEVIFYGHSLSQADYSYFQSIFDYYDIYNSSVTLRFLFSYYTSLKSQSDIKSDQLKSITSLLQSYGNTMTNKDHGKNLIHKLLLENRLKSNAIKIEKISDFGEYNKFY